MALGFVLTLTQFCRFRRLCVAYSQPGPASVDLAEAVIHQSLFIDRIVKLGWTAETRFQTVQSQTALIWSITRYHAFLSLMATNPDITLIPTIVRVAHYLGAPLLTGTIRIS